MFGQILKKLRVQKGLSQEELAEKMYVVRQTISKWENESSSPSVEQLVSLSAVFDTPPDMLLGINNGFSGRHHTIASLSEHAQGQNGTFIAASKREEMITNITKRLESMNETGVTSIFNLLGLIPDKERWMASTSQERIAELDAIEAQCEQDAEYEKEKAAKEAQEAAEAKRNQLYLDHARMFSAIKSINIPTHYDLGIEEIRAIDFICGGISRCFPEYAYSVACKYFKYGFVKGLRYGTAQAKKKQKQRLLSTISP